MANQELFIPLAARFKPVGASIFPDKLIGICCNCAGRERLSTS